MSRFLHHCREQRATELPLEKKVKTPGYATVRRLSTCIMYCSAHAGSNAGGEMASSGKSKRRRRRRVSRKMGGGGGGEGGISSSSSNSFALIWIPSEMSAEVGQWDLESLCCFLFSSTLSPHTLLSMGKMSNAIMRQRVRWWAAESDWTGEKGKRTERAVSFSGPLTGPVPADKETKTGSGKGKICITAPRGGGGGVWWGG